VATALIRPLAWEPPYAVCAALKKKKDKKKNQQEKNWVEIERVNIRELIS